MWIELVNDWLRHNVGKETDTKSKNTAKDDNNKTDCLIDVRYPSHLSANSLSLFGHPRSNVDDTGPFTAHAVLLSDMEYMGKQHGLPVTLFARHNERTRATVTIVPGPKKLSGNRVAMSLPSPDIIKKVTDVGNLQEACLSLIHVCEREREAKRQYRQSATLLQQERD
jgi:hypothetical protein